MHLLCVTNHSVKHQHLFDSCTLTVESLRSTEVTPLLHYYGFLRLPTRTFLVQHGHSQPYWISQVPRLLFPCALSPATPGSPKNADRYRFVVDDRLHHLRKNGHSQLRVTRPNRVHLRYGSQVRAARLQLGDYSFHCSLCYMLDT